MNHELFEDSLYLNWGNIILTLPFLIFSRLVVFDPGIRYPWLSPKSLRAWQIFDLTTAFSYLLTMSNTANDPDIDSQILQLGLVVSDTDAESNEI